MFKIICWAILGLAVVGGGYFVLDSQMKVAHNKPLINSTPIRKKKEVRSFASAGKGRHWHRRRQNGVILKLRPEATEEQVAALKSLYKAYDLQKEKQLLRGVAVRLKVTNMQFDAMEEEIVAQLRSTGALQFAEPDFYIPPAVVPNDEFYSTQWYHRTIQSEAAWNVSEGSTKVVVAICDAGFDLSHPELAARFISPGYNTVRDNNEVNDINDHGTTTAGVLAAVGNNGQGIAGMAWNVRLLPIQISDLPDGAATYSDVAECIQYAMDHGAKVVNISYDSAYTSSVVNEAALALRKAGGLVVVAGGNSALDLSEWGSSPNLLVVGATDPQDHLASFSNYGSAVDLLAPGLNIYTTSGGGGYSMFSGTSYSTPLVAGTAALLYSLRPNLSAENAEDYILSTLSNVSLPLGRLNAGAALQKAAEENPLPDQPGTLEEPTPTPTPTPTPVPRVEILLDNLDQGNSSDSTHKFTGKWCISNLPGSYGNASLKSCGPRLDTYRFIPSIATAKKYRVSLRFLSTSRNGLRVPVTIRSSKGTATKMVNMQADGGTWWDLGVYALSAGRRNYVEVSDAGGMANVDGVRFEEVP